MIASRPVRSFRSMMARARIFTEPRPVVKAS